MTELLIVREKLVRFMKDYETWFVIGAKFLGMFFVFRYINGGLGYFTLFDTLPVNILMALACSIIPGSCSVLIAALVILAHIYKISILLTILTAVVMLVLYLLFLRFSPVQIVTVLAAPVLMHYNLQFVLPVLIGSLLTPYAAIPAAVGIFLVKFLQVTVDASQITGTGITTDVAVIMEAVQTVFQQASGDKSVWFYAVVFLVTSAVVFVISQFSFDYVWYIAIFAGAVTEIVVSVIASAAFGVTLSFPVLLAGTIIGALLAMILRFFRCAVNYSGKEYVQFEDDDYYYYVKALPKFRFTLGGESAVEEESFELDDDESMENGDIIFDDETVAGPVFVAPDPKDN